MTTSNNLMVKFVLSPFLIHSFIFCMLFLTISVLILPVDIAFTAYLPGIALLIFTAGLSLIFHPPFIARVFSEERALKYQKFHKTRDILIALLAVISFIFILQPLCYVGYIITKNIPMVDAQLYRLDQIFGLNWFAYFQWVHDTPFLLPILEWSYNSMMMALVMSLVILRLMDRFDRVFVLIHSFIFTALTCMAIGAFFPALGATTFLISDLSLYPNFKNMPGSYAVSAIENLRAATGVIVFDPNKMPGLVTFPSFHTAGTIAIAFAFRRTVLEIPMWIYTAVVVASTPVFGGHYLIDLWAGAAIGFAVCTGVEKWMFVRRAGYFPSQTAPVGQIYSSPVTT